MVELLNRFIDRLNGSILTAKRRISLIIYYSFVWDALRRGYIKSRREEFNQYYSSESVSMRGSRSYTRPEIDPLVINRLESLKNSDYIRRTTSYCAIEGRCRADTYRSSKIGIKDCCFIGDDEEFECPIPAMSRLVRNYQIFSTAYVSVATLKYAFLSSVYYEWVSIDPVYTCYLPGRLGLPVEIPQSMPWVGFLVFSFHVLWRLLWYFGVKRLDCDCLLFLYYDRDTVLEKQFELAGLNDPKLPPEVAYKKYLCNKIFVEQRIDSEGNVFYAMRKHRTIEHHENLSNVTARCQLRSWSCVFTIWIPIVVWGGYTLMTHKYFDKSYPSCRSFSSNYEHDDTFTWSFEDKFRLMYFLYDALENVIFATETVSGLLFPWSAGSTLTMDLYMRLCALCDKLTELNTRLRSIVFKWHGNGHEMSLPLQMRFIEDIEEQSESIFRETIDAFKQTQEVDEFVRRLSQYSLFCCFMVELSFQILIMTRIDTLKDSPLLYWCIYSQIVSLLLLYGTFMDNILPYNQTRVLYHKICSAMALYPMIPKTKISWLWLLEYYHRCSTRCSLHLGKSLELSNLNVLRCMSWFGTCILIIISLWLQKLATQNH